MSPSPPPSAASLLANVVHDSMFNNTASYPLLLIGALQQTSILASLIVSDEAPEDAVERAKSYFLVFSTISSCLTFAVGPRLIDTEHAAEADPHSEASSQHEDEGPADDDPDQHHHEETGLLRGDRLVVPDIFQNPFAEPRSFFPSNRKPATLPNGGESKASRDRRASVVPRKHWIKLSPRAKWWLLFVSDFFNAPLVGAVLGAVIGLSPPLHRAFFNDTQHGGIFTAWLTASLKNIGTLFVPLPVVIAGTSLYTAYHDSRQNQDKSRRLPWGTVTYVMFIRFVIWPAVAIGLVYLVASRTSILGSDPMLWFAMMLMPW